MSFRASNDDIQLVYGSAVQLLNDSMTQLTDVSTVLNDFLKNELIIVGKTGDNLRNYIGEVHMAILAGLQESIYDLLLRVTIYANGYTENIDSDPHALLDEFQLGQIKKYYDSKYEEFDDYAEEISTALSNIKDIASVPAPNRENLNNSHSFVSNSIEKLIMKWYTYENQHNAKDFRKYDTIIPKVKPLIESQLGESRVSVESYQQWQAFGMTDYAGLITYLYEISDPENPEVEEANAALQAEYDKAIEEAKKTYDKLVDELVQQQNQQAFFNALGSMGQILTGAMLIIGTGGAAAPIVFAAAVVGGSCIVYGMSNLDESMDQMDKAAHRDITTPSSNFLRDTIFGGNQKMYDTWGEFNMTASMFIMPLNSSVNALSRVDDAAGIAQKVWEFGKTMTVEVGKMAINYKLSTEAGQYVTEHTGSQYLGSAVETLFSFVLDFGMDGIQHGLDSAPSKPKDVSSLDVDSTTYRKPFTTKPTTDMPTVKPEEHGNYNFDKSLGDTQQAKPNSHNDWHSNPNNSVSATRNPDFDNLTINSDKNYGTNYSRYDTNPLDAHPNYNRLATETVGYVDDLNYTKTVTSSKNGNIIFADNAENKSNKGKLPDWLQELFDKGNQFNKENRSRYPYNEVEVKGSKKNYVVDSYLPNQEIVSRKNTQLSEVEEKTAIGYLNELKLKYAPGSTITDSPFNPNVLKGTTLQGDMILEVPIQNKPIPKNIIDAANSRGITIRDITGKEYN